MCQDKKKQLQNFEVDVMIFLFFLWLYAIHLVPLLFSQFILTVIFLIGKVAASIKPWNKPAPEKE